MATKTKKPSNFPSDDQIKEWKEKHGKLHAFSCDDDDEIVLIMRNPGMKDLERANSSDPTGKKSFNFNRSLLANCKLWIADGVESDEPMLLSIFKQFHVLVAEKEITVKEL